MSDAVAPTKKRTDTPAKAVTGRKAEWSAFEITLIVAPGVVAVLVALVLGLFDFASHKQPAGLEAVLKEVTQAKLVQAEKARTDQQAKQALLDGILSSEASTTKELDQAWSVVQQRERELQTRVVVEGNKESTGWFADLWGKVGKGYVDYQLKSAREGVESAQATLKELERKRADLAKEVAAKQAEHLQAKRDAEEAARLFERSVAEPDLRRQLEALARAQAKESKGGIDWTSIIVAIITGIFTMLTTWLGFYLKKSLTEQA